MSSQTTRNYTFGDGILAEALSAFKHHFEANSEITVGRDGRERCTLKSIQADHRMKDVMRKIEEHLK